MNLYQIALPDRRNNGFGDIEYAERREVWGQRALRRAGGFTELGIRRGAWKDPRTGVVYIEPMHGYQVACDYYTMTELVQDALELFPDQLAIYVSNVGTAEIFERKAA